MRVSITKTKSSKLLYITKSTRVGNKVTTSTVKKLGKVDDLMKSQNLNSEQEVIDWAKNLAKQMTEKKQSGATTIVLNQQCQIELDDKRLFHGGYLFLQDILYDEYSTMTEPPILQHRATIIPMARAMCSTK